MRLDSIENINFKIKIYTKLFFNNLWFPIFKKAKFQMAKNTRICNSFFMILGEDLPLWTLIMMVPTEFEINNFEGYLSHSQVSKCSMRFLGSRKSPWTQISREVITSDAKHDDLKIFRIFESFGKSRNNFCVPPNSVKSREWFKIAIQWKWWHFYVSDFKLMISF